MSKQIQAGPVVFEVAAANGVASIKSSMSGSLGGGVAAGVLKASASVEADLSAQQVADLAIALLEAQFPSATALLEMVKSGVDSEIAKIVV